MAEWLKLPSGKWVNLEHAHEIQTGKPVCHVKWSHGEQAYWDADAAAIASWLEKCADAEKQLASVMAKAEQHSRQLDETMKRTLERTGERCSRCKEPLAGAWITISEGKLCHRCYGSPIDVPQTHADDDLKREPAGDGPGCDESCSQCAVCAKHISGSELHHHHGSSCLCVQCEQLFRRGGRLALASGCRLERDEDGREWLR